MKITKKHLRKIIRETLEGNQTTEIDGVTVTVAPKSEISAKAATARQQTLGKYRSDTHEIWTKKDTTSSEESLSWIQDMARGLPGSAKIYQDPDTGEVYAYAKYNTF